MERTPVASSNLRSVGYNPGEETLEIEFHNSGTYQYFGVPQHRYEGLMKAASKGSYFDSYIKKAGYRFRKIR